ncbi:GNAT family N-acetyltransferase [Fulvivirga sp. M361]|nr:GNAT family N-acetyltransferase [Fulvivirga sp. M361]
MKISPANRDDLPEILALQKECYLQEAEIYNDYNIPPLLQTLDSIRSDFEKGVFLKMNHNHQIIGSVRSYIAGSTGNIGRLVVHHRFQNQGLGKQLMLAIESEYNNGVSRFELFTGSKSTKNLSFYQKLGYVEFKRQPVNDRLELVFLEKKVLI